MKQKLDWNLNTLYFICLPTHSCHRSIRPKLHLECHKHTHKSTIYIKDYFTEVPGDAWSLVRVPLSLLFHWMDFQEACRHAVQRELLKCCIWCSNYSSNARNWAQSHTQISGRQVKNWWKSTFRFPCFASDSKTSVFITVLLYWLFPWFAFPVVCYKDKQIFFIFAISDLYSRNGVVFPDDYKS